MIRRVTLVAAFVAALFAPVLAQTQSQTRPHPPHPQGPPHDPAAHPPMDPALHAALHARLAGNWSGTLAGTAVAATKLYVAIANNKQGEMTVNAGTIAATKTSPAHDVALDAHGLHWTQPVAGKSCRATASLEAAASHHGADTMKGTMTCGQQEMTFTLQKMQ